jgi:hypothetical protein
MPRQSPYEIELVRRGAGGTGAKGQEVFVTVS